MSGLISSICRLLLFILGMQKKANPFEVKGPKKAQMGMIEIAEQLLALRGYKRYK